MMNIWRPVCLAPNIIIGGKLKPLMTNGTRGSKEWFQMALFRKAGS